MNNNQGMISCSLGCWIVAALAGLLAACLLWVLGGWSFWQGLFVGVILAVVAGALLSWILCKPLPAQGEVDASVRGTAGSGSSGAGAAAATGAAVAGGAAAAAGAASARSTSADTGASGSASAAAAPAADAASGSGSGAGSADASAATSGAASSSGPAVSSATTLPGEDELAGRTGSWSYEGDSDGSAGDSGAAGAAGTDAGAGAAAGASAGGAAAAASTVPDEYKPVGLSGPRGGSADDLKRIKGVGPKMENMLNGMGYYHFDQVGAWGDNEVAWVDDNLEGFKGRVTRDRWVPQAKILADGTAVSDDVLEKIRAGEDVDMTDYDKDGIVEGTGEGSRPEALTAARGGKADDLKQIKGIGPKLEKLCNTLGFYHFDQIAAWSADEVAWVDANLEGFKGRVTRDQWVAQAKTLAAGGETEFSKRVEDGDVY